MNRTNDNKDFAEFKKWSKICIITAITAFSVFGAGIFLLTVLKEFTDLEEKAPFLYGKVFAGILLAVFLAVLAAEIFFYVKARKCKKQIEKIENEEPENEPEER